MLKYFNILLKYRQAGASTFTSAYLAAKGAFADPARPEKILIVANKLETAIEFLSKIVDFLKQFPTWVNIFLNVKNKLTIKSLEHHDIFNTCARVEKEVSFMKFYTHGEYDISKSKMCKDFVKYKIKVCSESLIHHICKNSLAVIIWLFSHLLIGTCSTLNPNLSLSISLFICSLISLNTLFVSK